MLQIAILFIIIAILLVLIIMFSKFKKDNCVCTTIGEGFVPLRHRKTTYKITDDKKLNTSVENFATPAQFHEGTISSVELCREIDRLYNYYVLNTLTNHTFVHDKLKETHKLGDVMSAPYVPPLPESGKRGKTKGASYPLNIPSVNIPTSVTGSTQAEVHANIKNEIVGLKCVLDPNNPAAAALIKTFGGNRNVTIVDVDINLTAYPSKNGRMVSLNNGYIPGGSYNDFNDIPTKSTLGGTGKSAAAWDMIRRFIPSAKVPIGVEELDSTFWQNGPVGAANTVSINLSDVALEGPNKWDSATKITPDPGDVWQPGTYALYQTDQYAWKFSNYTDAKYQFGTYGSSLGISQTYFQPIWNAIFKKWEANGKILGHRYNNVSSSSDGTLYPGRYTNEKFDVYFNPRFQKVKVISGHGSTQTTEDTPTQWIQNTPDWNGQIWYPAHVQNNLFSATEIQIINTLKFDIVSALSADNAHGGIVDDGHPLAEKWPGLSMSWDTRTNDNGNISAAEYEGMRKSNIVPNKRGAAFVLMYELMAMRDLYWQHAVSLVVGPTEKSLIEQAHVTERNSTWLNQPLMGIGSTVSDLFSSLEFDPKYVSPTGNYDATYATPHTLNNTTYYSRKFKKLIIADKDENKYRMYFIDIETNEILGNQAVDPELRYLTIDKNPTTNASFTLTDDSATRKTQNPLWIYLMHSLQTAYNSSTSDPNFRPAQSMYTTDSKIQEINNAAKAIASQISTSKNAIADTDIYSKSLFSLYNNLSPQIGSYFGNPRLLLELCRDTDPELEADYAYYPDSQDEAGEAALLHRFLNKSTHTKTVRNPLDGTLPTGPGEATTINVPIDLDTLVIAPVANNNSIPHKLMGVVPNCIGENGNFNTDRLDWFCIEDRVLTSETRLQDTTINRWSNAESGTELLPSTINGKAMNKYIYNVESLTSGKCAFIDYLPDTEDILHIIEIITRSQSQSGNTVNTWRSDDTDNTLTDISNMIIPSYHINADSLSALDTDKVFFEGLPGPCSLEHALRDTIRTLQPTASTVTQEVKELSFTLASNNVQVITPFPPDKIAITGTNGSIDLTGHASGTEVSVQCFWSYYATDVIQYPPSTGMGIYVRKAGGAASDWIKISGNSLPPSDGTNTFWAANIPQSLIENTAESLEFGILAAPINIPSAYFEQGIGTDFPKFVVNVSFAVYYTKSTENELRNVIPIVEAIGRKQDNDEKQSFIIPLDNQKWRSLYTVLDNNKLGFSSIVRDKIYEHMKRDINLFSIPRLSMHFWRCSTHEQLKDSYYIDKTKFEILLVTVFNELKVDITQIQKNNPEGFDMLVADIKEQFFPGFSQFIDANRAMLFWDTVPNAFGEQTNIPMITNKSIIWKCESPSTDGYFLFKDGGVNPYATFNASIYGYESYGNHPYFWVSQPSWFNLIQSGNTKANYSGPAQFWPQSVINSRIPSEGMSSFLTHNSRSHLEGGEDVDIVNGMMRTEAYGLGKNVFLKNVELLDTQKWTLEIHQEDNTFIDLEYLSSFSYMISRMMHSYQAYIGYFTTNPKVSINWKMIEDSITTSSTVAYEEVLKINWAYKYSMVYIDEYILASKIFFGDESVKHATNKELIESYAAEYEVKCVDKLKTDPSMNDQLSNTVSSIASGYCGIPGSRFTGWSTPVGAALSANCLVNDAINGVKSFKALINGASGVPAELCGSKLPPTTLVNPKDREIIQWEMSELDEYDDSTGQIGTILEQTIKEEKCLSAAREQVPNAKTHDQQNHLYMWNYPDGPPSGCSVQKSSGIIHYNTNTNPVVSAGAYTSVDIPGYSCEEAVRQRYPDRNIGTMLIDDYTKGSGVPEGCSVQAYAADNKTFLSTWTPVYNHNKGENASNNGRYIQM